MKKLTIYLGSKCNLNCAYCHRKADDDEPKISDKLLAEIGDGKDMTIKFIGGEPTLYMDQIRRIVDAAPKANFVIATNGLGIEKYLDYFYEHQFLVCISYDGTGKEVRQYDPFTKLLQYPWLAVSCTIYHGNTDLKKILHRFADKEKVIGRPISLFPHIVHVTSDANDKYGLTINDCDELMNQIKTMVGTYLDHLKKYGIANRRYDGLFQGLKARYEANYEFGETYCVNHSLAKCNAKGECFPCLYIREQKLSDNWKKEQANYLDEHFPRCRICSVYDMCGGACIVSKRHEIECYYYKKLYTWFKGAYKKFLEEVAHG